MSAPSLVNHLGRPLFQERISGPSRESGAYRGSINTWRPRRTISERAESGERGLTQDRAADLYANDFAARSAIDSIATNAVGTGLTPQPRIPYKLLGISEDEAYEVKEQMEWLWSEWCTEAHAAGSMHFEDLQLSGLRSVLRSGEMLHVPVMEEGGEFSLAVQPLSPRRLRTPADKTTDASIRDGVHLSPSGRSLGYWIAAPKPSLYGGIDCSMFSSALTSADFRYIPARIGHRPGIFHLFRHDEEEQVRGVSSLSAGVKLFRNLSDAIDFELLAQVLAASFPVFVGLENGRPGLPDNVMEQMGFDRGGEAGQEKRYTQTVDPGQVWYGNPGEKPEVLESKRPSQNFLGFVELILRAMGASLGIPYEVLFKDFSKTNYSSARAALNEAWKLFQLYRQWFARSYCHPLWTMVQEEAYLRGRLSLPHGAPDFYEKKFCWCNAYWYGPSRGYVDPVKEIQANILAIGNRLMTRTEHWAQQGGDFWEGMDQIEAEERRMATMPAAAPVTGLKKSAPAGKAAKQESEDADDDKERDDADD